MSSRLMIMVSVGGMAAVTSPVAAQDAELDLLKVYLDCASFRCDQEQFRQEIQFVNWVRQPEDADVYILMTDERSGAGAFRYTFDFEGRGDLEGIADQLGHSSSVTDVEDEVKGSLRRILAVGISRYVAAAGFASSLDIQSSSEEPSGVLAGGTDEQRGAVDDPWNAWVFNLNGNLNLSRTDRRKSDNYGFSVNANRTTEEWKINFRVSGNFSRTDLILSDGSVAENNQDNGDIGAFAVRSLGEHWGVGLELEADNSTRLNRDLLVAAGTGIEYNYFPYSESNRRVLLARYVVSAERVDYKEETVFNLLEETVYKHEIGLDFEERGPWGNANMGIDASQFLDRPKQYSAGVRGFIRYRLFRGLSVNLNADYDIVDDQIFLPLSDLSDEDILLGRRTLPTDTEWSVRVGFGFNFGSIFNNAVNSRFRRGVR